MIIAWTLFVILTLLALISAKIVISAASVNNYDEAVKHVWMTILFVLLASIPAQYIWGGGL